MRYLAQTHTPEPFPTVRVTEEDRISVQAVYNFRVSGIVGIASHRQIRRELLNHFDHLSDSQIYRILAMEPGQTVGGSGERARSTRRLVSTPEIQCIRDAIAGNAEYRRMTFGQLSLQLNLGASRRTMQRRLNERGVYRRVARRAPFLTARHREHRLAWAEAHIDWDIEQWNSIIWQDESQMQNGGMPRLYVTRAVGEEWNPECLQPKMRRPQKSVYVSGLMCGSHKSDLQIIPRGTGVRGGMTAKDFVEHVAPEIKRFHDEMVTMYPYRSFVLMLDNSSIHGSDIVQRWFQDAGIQLTQWPANSPDLNPIEHCWALMKRMLRNQYDINTQEKYEDAVLEAWNAIQPEHLQNFIESMENRCVNVIARQGGHSGY